jgi:hypothetical protein
MPLQTARIRAEWVPPSEVPEPVGPGEVPEPEPEQPTPGPGEIPVEPEEAPSEPPPEVRAARFVGSCPTLVSEASETRP